MKRSHAPEMNKAKESKKAMAAEVKSRSISLKEGIETIQSDLLRKMSDFSSEERSLILILYYMRFMSEVQVSTIQYYGLEIKKILWVLYPIQFPCMLILV